MLKRLLLIFLLFAIPCAAQDLRPSAYVGKPGVVTVRAGKVQGSFGGVTSLASQDITPTAGATTYIYVNLSSTPVIATNTSGFPGSNYFPICSVITDGNGNITTFTDSRPDYFMAGGSGGTPGGSNTQVQYNSSGAFAGAASATINPAGNYLTISINNAGAASLQLTNAAGGNTRVVNLGANAFVTNQGDLANLFSIATLNNCSSSASPAVCSSAPAGSVVIAAAATTVQVNTSAVTANSQIQLTRDDSLGTRLSVTCNTQSSLVLGTPRVTARTAATSFTISIDVGPTTNPMCISYSIIN